MATLETGHFRLPPQLDINSGNISENFKQWKRQVEVYLAASDATAKDKKVQTAIILNCAGPEVLEVYNNFTWESEGDEEKPDKVLEALERYCNPRNNEVFESHKFWNTPYQEPFDKFVTELQTRAVSCNFQEKDRMIRDKIVFTVTGKLQELLLREDDLTLEKTLKICRAFEQSNKQVKELRSNVPSNTSNLSAQVHKLSNRPNEKANDRKELSNDGRIRPKVGALYDATASFVATNMNASERNAPLGARRVIIAKAPILNQSVVKGCMQSHNLVT